MLFFTATGAALGILALLGASETRWAISFAWLGAALFVDAAGGPLARRLEVKRVLPRFSGEDLDKIVDYLTYVAVPAFMVARGPLVPEALRLPLAAALIALCALLTFVPIRFVHPVRVKRLRLLTFAVTAAWTAAAIAAVVHGFPAGGTVQAIFAASAVHGLALSLTAPGENPDTGQ